MMLDKSLLLKYFSQQVANILGYRRIKTANAVHCIPRKWRVALSAIAYFRGFYRKHTLLDYDPRLILLSCIFLSGKVEQDFVKVADLERVYPGKFSDSLILASEIVLLEAINFDLKVFHAQNCVYAVISDLKRLVKSRPPASRAPPSVVEQLLPEQEAMQVDSTEQEVSLTQADSAIQIDSSKALVNDDINSWLSKVEEVLFALQLTDAAERFNPASIALCSMMIAGAPSLRPVLDSDFDRYLSDKLNAVLSIDDLQGLKHSDQQVLFELYQEGKKPIDEEHLKSNLLFLRANQRWKDNLAMLANIRGSSASSN